MLNHNYIGTEHILLGLIREGDGVAAKALEAMDVSLQRVRDEVEDIVGQGQAASAGHIPFTPRAKKVLELSLREALQLGHNYVGTEHILLGLIREGEGVAAQALGTVGADLNRVRQTVIQLLSGHAGFEPRPSEGWVQSAELGVEVMGADFPICRRCGSSMSETAATKRLVVPGETEADEPLQVTILYCRRCGVALGLL